MNRARWSVTLAAVSLLVLLSVLAGLAGCAPAPTPTLTPTPTQTPILPGPLGQTLAPRLTALPGQATAVPTP